MQGMSSGNIYSGYNSSSGPTYSWEWRIDPTYTVAEVVPYQISGGGLHRVGIAGYRRRPTPGGAEEAVNFGSWPNWPGILYIDSCSAVTFASAVGASQELRAACNLMFW
ncbi:hypothetical protein AB2M62_17210 [Sphingomonas sp. MMS12-HWE2-04]|uniref:hypothetical protein n=1 Tax=Sphingomonas sp. MMS12-HWE2-04 TaxID=3234199 RepID=UPI0038506E9C